MAKLRYDDVKAELSSLGWILEEQSYTNLDTEMRMKCPEGHTIFASLKQWRRNHKCSVCDANPYTVSNVTATKKEAGKKRVLAIDQATSVSGWCVFDDDKLVTYGHFTVESSDPAKRISRFNEWLIDMITKWRPDHIALEDIQLQLNKGGQGIQNVQIFKTLAQLQGVLINTCMTQGIEHSVIFVEKWRSYCEIRGQYRADRKRSAQMKVKEWYDVSVTQDEADAICIGKFVAEKYLTSNIMLNWGE